MAENSVSNSLPSSHQHPKTAGRGGGGGGGGSLLHHNKSLDMTSSGGGSNSGGSTSTTPGKGGGKHANVIHRTTSESLRLGGGPGGSGGGGGSSVNDSSISSSTPPSSLMHSSGSINSISRAIAAATAAVTGKTSSFMITSVTVGARTSADNGDDSADDLDESHTDDNSRITDFENETPSFSEDTFSKEDVFFASNAIGSVPVIPTSSQYGLAIVAPTDRGHGAEALADAMHVSVTDAGINIMGHAKDDGKDPHHRNERFKVVKIESTEPFKRGRWVCMDYLDHSTLQASPKEGASGAGEEASAASTIVDSNSIRTQDSGVVLNENYASNAVDGDNSDYHTHLAASVPANPILGLLNNESPGQSLNLTQPAIGTSAGGTIPQSQQTSHAQPATVPHSLPQAQLQNALAGAGAGAGNGSVPVPAAQPQGQSQYYPHTMSNMADITQQQQPQPQLQQHHQHGVTLPSNIQMQPQQANSAASVSSTVLPPVATAPSTSQEMNIVIANPQHQQSQQTSFPSPQQFQQPSQTNSPVVASIGEPMPTESVILSPSSSLATAGSVSTSSVAGNLPPQQPESAAPAASSEPLVTPSASTTSSPVTATAVNSESSISAPAASSTPSSAANAATVSSPSMSSTTGVATTTSASSQQKHASIAAAAAAAADHLSESNLLSAVAGITAAAVAGTGGEDGEKSGEDGESSGRIQPAAAASAVSTDWTVHDSMADNQTGARQHLPLSLTSSLQRDLQQNIPLDRTRIPNSSASSSTYKNTIYTDIALGRSIQNVMRPSSIGGSRFGAAATSSTHPETQHQDESLCKSAFNFLKGGGNSHSIASCTAKHPHKCVQDLIKEEFGGYGGSTGSGSLSNAGSLVNIHVESDYPPHGGGIAGIPGGFQSNPGSGRNSPSHQLFHHGSPPKLLNAIGHSISIPNSTRVSRAPSPSFLHAVAGDHPSASGTSAVAIDNKIEQAMDLVKSHLMFAVREEVEVLKEKISELMDRINQLEYENNILKQNASQETLSQLTTSGGGASNASTTAAAAAVVAAAAAAAAATAAAAASASAPSAPASKGPSSAAANPSSNGSVS
ncbi:protein bunched, class 2/F/G isoform [Armigeres subalbatus]|uniref:protein bunched, class 2/F/G isoform n=1 Tax=Armigeres subalbatus TaxID=124917 RepID=UPI002ED2DEE2